MNILQRRRFTSLLKSTTNTLRKSRSLLRLVLLVGLMPMAALALGSSSSAENVLGPLFTRAVAMFGNKQAAAETKVARVNAALSSAAAEADLPLNPTSTMTVERRGHTATRLSDGRVLIAGGENSSATLNGTEIYDPATATFSTTGNMNAARADHTATLLSDGRVLIAGGRNGSESQATTEIFDPATGTFASGPNMGVARAGHSATLFTDGRIMFAGGDAVGSAEILDATLSNFTATGSMNAARSMHSAALLQDGRVLIVGGHDIDANAVLSGEIFDTASGSFSTVAGTLTVARVRAHLRVLFDGKVQIIGGGNDGSMEIYDPSIARFGAYSHVLPETDSCANLQPGILAAQTRAALFHNAQSNELLDRSGQTITELGNSALVVGGANSSGAVLNSTSVLTSNSSSISTDKLDYAPGETAIISGRGFEAGEIVRVKIHEDPHTPQERGFDITADADGNFTGEYLVMNYDLNMKFIVSARGLTSGRTAHTTFTDAELVTSEVTGTADDVTITQGGGSVLSNISLSATGAMATAITSASPSTAKVHTIYTLTGGVLASGTPSSAKNFFAGTTGCGGPNCEVTWTGDPTPYSVSATFSADLATPAGNYPVVLSSAAGTTQITNPSGPGGKLADGTLSTINVHVRLAAPSALSATGVSQTQIDLSWTDNSTGESNFVIESSANAGGPFTALATVGAGVTTYSHTGLTCDTTRHYRVKATKTTPTGLDSDYSGITNATTNSCCDAPSIITNPINQTVTYGASSVGFTAAAGGDTPTVQWQVQVGGVGAFVDLADVAPYSGVTTGTLLISNPTVSLSGNNYQAVFTNTCNGTQTATSGAAMLTVDPKTLTASIIGNPTKPYDGNDNAVLTPSNFSISGLIGSDSFSVTKTSGTYNSADVASATTVTTSLLASDFTPGVGTSASNYNLPTTASGAGQITKATAVITVTGFSGVYDGDPHGVVSSSAKGVNNEDLMGLSIEPTTYTDVPGGSIHWTFTNQNYEDQNGDAAVVIEKRTLTATIIGNPTKVYDGNTDAVLTTANFSLGNLVGLQSFTVTKATGTYNSKDVATANTVSTTLAAADFTPGGGANANNYNLPTSASGPGHITAKALTIKAEDTSMPYGGPIPVYTVTYTTLVSGDTPSSLGGTLTFTVKDMPAMTTTITVNGSTPSGTYAIIPCGLTSTNYTITFTHGILTIYPWWTITGFYQPVDMNTPSLFVWNTIKGGSTVPLKFNIYAGTPGPLTERKNVSDVMFGSVQVADIPCGVTQGIESFVDLVTNTGNTTLRYDTTGAQFIQNWQTPKGANKCYQVRMTALDGSHIDAYFKTK